VHTLEQIYTGSWSQNRLHKPRLEPEGRFRLVCEMSSALRLVLSWELLHRGRLYREISLLGTDSAIEISGFDRYTTALPNRDSLSLLVSSPSLLWSVVVKRP
jgi:hypothetical protein